MGNEKRFRTEDMPMMLQDVFQKMQELINMADMKHELNARFSGTTATVCIHDHIRNKITVAHIGNCKCILGKRRDVDSRELQAVSLTRDHKPELCEERGRIESCGARVIFDGYANHRVCAKKSDYPGLSLSRCFGDIVGHEECGIICEPDVFELNVGPLDAMLLLCSDGVWEFIGPQAAINIVSQFPISKAGVAVDSLAKESWDQWVKKEGSTAVDDITAIAAHLQGKDFT